MTEAIVLANPPSATKQTRKRTPAKGRQVSVYAEIYLAAPFKRVEIIKKGISVFVLHQTIKEMGLTNEQTFQMLNFPRSTVGRKMAAKKTLTTEQSERFIGLQRLIGQVELMVQQSGTAVGFDAAKWAAHWLKQPSAALGGKQPADFMDTVQGQAIVSDLLAQMQSGAYA